MKDGFGVCKKCNQCPKMASKRLPSVQCQGRQLGIMPYRCIRRDCTSNEQSGEVSEWKQQARTSDSKRRQNWNRNNVPSRSYRSVQQRDGHGARRTAATRRTGKRVARSPDP